MKFTQMCETAAAQTARTGDENRGGTEAEKQQPLRQKERGGTEGGRRLFVHVGLGKGGSRGCVRSLHLSLGSEHYVK